MINTLKKKAENLCTEIRGYSESQAKLWRKIPFLALQADGRTGFSDKYSMAYNFGYWNLEFSIKEGKYTIIVDLESGRLMEARSFGDVVLDDVVNSGVEPREADDKEIIGLAFNLDEINAQRIISDLANGKKSPYPSYYNPEKQKAWRKKTRKELCLEEIFSRKSKMGVF